MRTTREIITCDRCGIDITDDKGNVGELMWDSSFVQLKLKVRHDSDTLDLCLTCSDAFGQWWGLGSRA